MQCHFNQTIAIAIIFSCFIVWASAEGFSCSSCGDECLDACGTRFFRTCCFNYLRKRSSPPLQPQSLNEEIGENSIWLDKGDLEKLVRNDLLHSQNFNRLDLGQKQRSKGDFQKSTPSSNANGISNGRDQMHVIYDI